MSEDKTIIIDQNSIQPDFGKCPICGIMLKPDQTLADVLRCPTCRYVKKQKSIVAIGNVIGNKYRILSRLGHGGCGDIFICHPLADIQTRYVLKVLQNPTTTSRKRFRREASILSSIQNAKRISKIIDYWESGDDTFIIMEYINGKNLHQLYSEYEFDESATLNIASEIVAGLQYIWENHSVIHRDIKPENIMLDEEFRVKILDFGLSKQQEHGNGTTMNITLEMSSLGTPGYMSPEQFADTKNVDFRSDIFSLGALMFFLLTGQKPFNGTTPAEIYSDTIKNSPPPREKFDGKCSDKCISLIRKMMQYAPDKRHNSYEELANEIESLLS